jgi:transitional endoplasmic reticulum ATPase
MTAGYSGADLEALCREAGLNALRKDINSKEVTLEDFEMMLKEILPSITPDMEKWYQENSQRFRQVEKPIPAIA